MSGQPHITLTLVLVAQWSTMCRKRFFQKNNAVLLSPVFFLIRPLSVLLPACSATMFSSSACQHSLPGTGFVAETPALQAPCAHVLGAKISKDDAASWRSLHKSAVGWQPGPLVTDCWKYSPTLAEHVPVFLQWLAVDDRQVLQEILLVYPWKRASQHSLSSMLFPRLFFNCGRHCVWFCLQRWSANCFSPSHLAICISFGHKP